MFIGPYINDQWITFLKLLKYAKESDQVEEWEYDEIMKIFLPYIDRILNSLETPDVHLHQDRDANLVDLNVNPCNPKHADMETSSDELDSDDDALAIIKEKRLYTFKLSAKDILLTNEVQKNPILCEKAIGKDEDLKA